MLPENVLDHDFNFGAGASRTVQSMVTLLRTWVTSSVAMTLSSSPARERFRSCPWLRRRCRSRLCVVERDLESPAVALHPLRVVVQSEVDVALGRGAHFFGELACRAEAAAKVESALR